MDSGETKIFISILIATGILGIIVIYFIITIVRSQRRYLRLQRGQLMKEIATLEFDRKRIVSDLHDELGPLLSVVKFQIIGLDIATDQDVLIVNKAANNIDIILHRIREICNHMMPQALISKGLFVAINEFISELAERIPVKIEFTYHPVPFEPGAEIHIYRILQEIITNTIKHSNAEHLRIDITSENKMMILRIDDNGIGFNSDLILHESTGLGLKNILNRTHILNGDLYIDSSPGKGTSFTIEIPKVLHEPQNTIDNSG
ncbi:MAG TPA: ATP-binding protein [Flavitalea sp.]|nr:ATP-binding protein [Flavitalea sp.]